MEMARKLLDGKFHEDDDIFDDDENPLHGMAVGKATNLNKGFTAKNADDMEKQNKFDEFESALHQIFNDSEKFKAKDCD